MSNKSCVGCKFLYFHDRGWSNWIVEETEVICAKDRNPNLPASKPWDWEADGEDEWTNTKCARCECYAPGALIKLDVDGEVKPEEFTNDAEVISLINAKGE